MREKSRSWDNELLNCPECNDSLRPNDMKFIQEGVAERTIYCSNSDCSFEAIEQWVISETRSPRVIE